MNRELTFDEAEAAGFDGTGRDGDPRFPYHESDVRGRVRVIAHEIEIDVAYDEGTEEDAVWRLSKKWGLDMVITGHANGWPVVRVRGDYATIAELLVDRQEEWMIGEIEEVTL